MKKFYLLISLILFISSCSKNSENVSDNTSSLNNKTESYQEIETSLNNETIYPKYIDEEIEKLQNQLWHTNDEILDNTSNLYKLQRNHNSNEVKYLTVYKDNKPSEFKINENNCQFPGEWCEITYPGLPTEAIKQNPTMPIDLAQSNADFYGFNTDIYTISDTTDYNEFKATGEFKGKEYTVFQNDKALFSASMEDGAEGPIVHAQYLNELDLPAFTFRRPDNNLDIAINGEFMNEKYKLDSSHLVFTYNKKIGFVAEKDGESFIFFDGKKISANFDEIRTAACCAAFAFPIEVYKNGTLFFMGQKGEKYFFTEINLNQI